MNDITQLGAFARRQLRSLHDTALAGAKQEALKLRVSLLRAEEELARGAVPSGEFSAARLNYWLSQLEALRDMKSVLDADAGKPTGLTAADIQADLKAKLPRTHYAGDGCDPPHDGMRKIKVRFTGLGKPKTLTYQTAQNVALDQEVEVPRWPGMKPGPPLRGTVVALESDREGPLATIIGG